LQCQFLTVGFYAAVQIVLSLACQE
jgi:hypothetical protein